MRKTSSGPAQRQLVHQFIDWKLVGHRCGQYPAIGRAFKLSTLKDGFERGPYFCHYMAWRLGTWIDETLIQRLEELLLCAETLPNWEHEQSRLSSFDFAEFWSLVWQLQVAEYLCEVGSDVKWAKSGPDLSVIFNNKRWYVECYAPRKSFGVLVFLNELFERLDGSIRISYDLCSPFQLPLNSKRCAFIDAILSPFLVPAFLEDAKSAATKNYPVILYKDANSSLHIYVEGDDVDTYRPGIVPNQVGSPEAYLEVALREAIEAKQGKNKLDQHHPNLVAVNFLLSADFQLAINSSKSVDWGRKFGTAHGVDAVAISVLGIDAKLTKESLQAIHVLEAEREPLSEFVIVPPC